MPRYLTPAQRSEHAHLHVAAVDKVVSQDGYLALLAQGSDHADVRRVKCGQGIDKPSDPILGLLDLAVVVNPEKEVRPCVVPMPHNTIRIANHVLAGAFLQKRGGGTG